MENQMNENACIYMYDFACIVYRSFKAYIGDKNILNIEYRMRYT